MALDFNGRRMCTASTASTGVVSSDTVLVFEQVGDVVSARYRGGSIVDGYLIGHLDGATPEVPLCAGRYPGEPGCRRLHRQD